MDSEKELRERSENSCELCGAKETLSVYDIPLKAEVSILTCETCIDQINNSESINATHWRCLNDSIWSPIKAVQVVSWRMLNRLRHEGWPIDLLDMMYLDEETLAWAKETEQNNSLEPVKHIDSNGELLESGDTVVLIKDLNVKGASFTAKRGTAVRRISLVHDNPEHIEGKIEGQQIVILTKYVKKST